MAEQLFTYRRLRNIPQMGTTDKPLTRISRALYLQLPPGTPLLDWKGMELAKGDQRAEAEAQRYEKAPDTPMMLGFPSTPEDQRRGFEDWEAPYRES